MNEIVVSIIALLSGMTLPDTTVSVARYHQNIVKAEHAYFIQHDTRKGMMYYDSAFAQWPGLMYDHLHASFAAMDDYHYRKFDEYICMGNKAGLNLEDVRRLYRKTDPARWESFSKHVDDVRVGFYGFFRYKFNFPKASYRSTSFRVKRIHTRDMRVHNCGIRRMLCMKSAERRHLKKLQEITVNTGYPDIRHMGDAYPCKDCAYPYTSILQHHAKRADFPQTLKRFYPELLKALESGGLYTRSIPFLIDTYLFYQGAPQLFGTLHVYRQGKDKVWKEYLHPVADLALANQWRNQFYLNPLEDQIKMTGVNFLE
jgi:hypothetical protein